MLRPLHLPVSYTHLDVYKRQELHKAIRRHKIDVFEVIEETVENLLVSGWGDNPFFNEFVEVKSMNIGDTNEFYVPDEMCIRDRYYVMSRNTSES